ncbi:MULTISPECIES: HAMP domain-containing methyl-accepting chemotaxis protein [unclassified Paenibacillus]|uniref:methyl-accepting chemotaxis protein n=1 Tax=unclassified Paenibacillus TaxID=185978 RepID=UPI001048D806|nr:MULTISPECIES: HAMP domain-containing methyl-accepting chemotaxis protein [unclassified Paenibacillus]NIK70519.1 methyl-accepting chemotaxis protein [Paenibacillus sp. BK720]TCM91018.1 methyl-accepting chemotaxis protein [Paenibacillus sp. BK033]
MLLIRRMSFFTKMLLLAFINIILIGTILISSSYMTQKDILIEQLRGQIIAITQEWAKEIDPAVVAQAIEQKSYQGSAQAELQVKFDEIHKYNPNIAQAYIFGTELEDGNKTSLVAMPTSLVEAFSAENINIGDMYEQPSAMASAVAKMLKTGKPTFTSFYSDSFGTWTSVLYPIVDSQGNSLGFFAADVDASAVPEGLHKLLVNGITIMVIFMLIIFLIQFFVSRRTMKPIKELVRGIDTVSTGNLNVELKTGSDDLGMVNQKFNQMVSRINDMMLQVQHTSHAVTNSAKNLHEISELNSKNTNLITASVQEISGGIGEQKQATMDTARAMAELATVIQTIAENSSKVAHEAYDMEQKSIEGNSAVKQVMTQMEQIQTVVSKSTSAIKLLDSRSQEIENIVSIIMNISGQTNLLALNAAIEAARVGEHGKGFAVVAGEVRKLAEQSDQSANQISELVKEIQDVIRIAVEALEQGTYEVIDGLKVTSTTEQLLNEILQATQNVTMQIQEVSSSTEELSAGTEELTATSESLSSAVSVTAVNSAKISDSVEEQKESMSAIVDSSTELTALSEKLQKLLNQFQVKG